MSALSPPKRHVDASQRAVMIQEKTTVLVQGKSTAMVQKRDRQGTGETYSSNTTKGNSTVMDNGTGTWTGNCDETAKGTPME